MRQRFADIALRINPLDAHSAGSYALGSNFAPQQQTRIMPHDLTSRETEVVRYISLGCSNEEIGKLLGLATSTVDTHRSNAMTKLGVSKMALLTRLAIKHKICKLNETLTPAEKRKLRRKRDGWN